ncbi:hypothetical protein DXV76_09130 [Rhodobacteraceae bacterium CCMM004]|nr:hypothetical protein DXV76_09130 [Rhodobacteraceae bacterium CCMM004]
MERDHGHSPDEIRARIDKPKGRGYLRDLVYGAMDGAVTTFAIVAGVAGAGLSPRIVIALGLANILADGFSMAAGNYTATQSERDEVHRIVARERRHIRENPEGEMAELREILARKGLDDDLADRAAEAIARDRDRWIAIMLTDEYGLAPVDPHPMRAALATFVAFMAAGLIPLIPFAVGMTDAFATATGLTLAVFFSIGALKSRWSLHSWWREGGQTLLIGGAAAALAYGVGRLFHV